MGIFSKFLSKIKVTELLHKPDLDELADELIAADIGADLAHAIIEQVQKMKSATPEESLHTVLLSHLSKKERTISTASGVTAVMVVGVNGTGKTTLGKILVQEYNIYEFNSSNILSIINFKKNLSEITKTKTLKNKAKCTIFDEIDGIEKKILEEIGNFIN